MFRNIIENETVYIYTGGIEVIKKNNLSSMHSIESSSHKPPSYRFGLCNYNIVCDIYSWTNLEILCGLIRETSLSISVFDGIKWHCWHKET